MSETPLRSPQQGTDPKIIREMAENIVLALNVCKFTPDACISVVTTALMHYLTTEIRKSPIGHFKVNQQDAIDMLDQLKRRILVMREGQPDARDSQDDPSASGRDGTPN